MSHIEDIREMVNPGLHLIISRHAVMLEAVSLAGSKYLEVGNIYGNKVPCYCVLRNLRYICDIVVLMGRFQQEGAHAVAAEQPFLCKAW